MTIRRLLIGIVLALSLALIGLAAVTVQRRLADQYASETALLVNQASDGLLTAAALWAQERGLANGALAAERAAAGELIKSIADKRSSGDDAAARAIALIRPLSGPALTARLSALKEAQTALSTARNAVDVAIAEDRSARTGGIATTWFPTASSTVVAALSLRVALVQSVSRDKVGSAESIKTFLAQIAEFAGRERGYLQGVITAGRGLNSGDLLALGALRGRIDLSWERVQLLAESADLKADMARPVEEIKSVYFDRFDGERRALYEDGLNGRPYKLSASQWFEQATAAIAPVLAAQKSATQVAKSSAEKADSDAREEVALWLVIVAVAVVISGGGLYFVQARIIGSLAALEKAMVSLASGTLDIVISGAGRRDEVGAMARSVRVFQDNAVKVRALEEEQVAQRERAEEARRQSILTMADKVEVETANAVTAIASAAREVSVASSAMAVLAKDVSGHSQAVAAAAGQTMANVETVSSAAEELTASVQEIGGQVTRASSISREAVTTSKEADAAIRNLSESVGKIAEVSDLINAIAGQTNLLALNATIEAARAGAAGKGFAVVAAEVKNLASQTSRSTEEISRRISEIEAGTSVAVQAVSAIARRIEEVDQVASAIAAAMEEQAAATREIARNIAETATASNEVSKRIDTVSQEAVEVGQRTGEVQSAVASVTANIENLQTILVRVVRGATDDANRRAHPRLEIRVSVEVDDEMGRPAKVVTANVSEGGARVDLKAGDVIRERGRLRFQGMGSPIAFRRLHVNHDGASLAFEFSGSDQGTFLAWLEQQARATSRFK